MLGNSNSELELTPELGLFFIRVGVELEWNFTISGWSWSGVAVAIEWSWSGVGVKFDNYRMELERSCSGYGVELERSWSGI